MRARLGIGQTDPEPSRHLVSLAENVVCPRFPGGTNDRPKKRNFCALQVVKHRQGVGVGFDDLQQCTGRAGGANTVLLPVL